MKSADKPHLKVQVWILCPSSKSDGKRWKVLLLKMRKKRGGFWQPVTGSVEKGERLKEAALREAQEETGLPFKSGPLSLGEKFQFECRWRGLCEEHVFFIRVGLDEKGELPEVRLDPHEHTDYEWMSPSAALKRLGFVSNRRMLRVLQKNLRERSERKSKKRK